MVKGARLLWIRQQVLASVVLDRDVALFDVDIGRSVFAHGSQLDEMALRAKFANSEEHVHRAYHIIYLREDGVLAVDHGIRSGALLSEVNDGVGSESLDRRFEEIVIGDVTHKKLDGLAS